MSKENALTLMSKATMGLSKLPVATLKEIESTEIEIARRLPDSLKDFYETASNGLRFGRLQILPVKSSTNLRKTGDSIARQNDIRHSIWFNNDAATFAEFLIFATENSQRCFAFKRDSEYVWEWKQDEGQVVELDYSFWDWLEESLHQERDLLRFKS
ncbi:SMI1/KNR4 family protein [Pseudoduganella armeniaca]|uniref:Knr4/Smi1-like domain-containing protein n=1 Tax=Pseudoduganella armeniaca TaxID=2072590 RepID=A0A2R4CCD5_9BURK|nr:SMI1/KNR4 family protein [Pseudoduganella armeniaca]AVR97287.1 hypothetical protein C9I28_17790 [Pseudoduganella armeniaca]